MPSAKFQVPNSELKNNNRDSDLQSGTRHSALDIRHSALGIRHSALGIRHLALGIRHYFFFFLFSFFVFLPGCVSVQAYQRMYLDDPDMELQPRKLERFETDVETYREGAAGGTQGTAGGGCGCF